MKEHEQREFLRKLRDLLEKNPGFELDIGYDGSIFHEVGRDGDMALMDAIEEDLLREYGIIP